MTGLAAIMIDRDFFDTDILIYATAEEITTGS